MKYLTLNPGSILLWKEYNWFKRFWSKITKKQLLHNKYIIIPKKVNCLFTNWTDSDYQIVEPKKQYSSVEREQLVNALNSTLGNSLLSVNLVRPFTFDASDLTLESVKRNKYYREVHAE